MWASVHFSIFLGIILILDLYLCWVSAKECNPYIPKKLSQVSKVSLNGSYFLVSLMEYVQCQSSAWMVPGPCKYMLARFQSFEIVVSFFPNQVQHISRWIRCALLWLSSAWQPAREDMKSAKDERTYFLRKERPPNIFQTRGWIRSWWERMGHCCSLKRFREVWKC